MSNAAGAQRAAKCARALCADMGQGVTAGFYSRPLRIAAMTRGLRLPCMTARTHSGFSAGAYAIR